jgi:ABC-type oligopeptide transport system substrate-binding subunit
MTQLCLFEKGDIDWLGKPLSGLPLDACAILKKEKKISLHTSCGVYWYFFNTDRFPFTNRKIRQAFAFAINRREITEYVLQANEQPANSILPPSYGINQEGSLLDNNKEKARRLLAEGLEELGIKRKNLPEITINYNSDEIHQNVAQIVQQQIFAVETPTEGSVDIFNNGKIQFFSSIVKAVIPSIVTEDKNKMMFVYFYWTFWMSVLPLYFLSSIQSMCGSSSPK